MLDFFIILALIAVAIGSFTDIKTLEVPDWLNYSLIAIGLFGNLALTIFYTDWLFFQRSVLGFGFAFILGMLMYYTGQWGGGDSKMLFGLGAMFGIDYPFAFSFFMKFIVNMLFFGAFYGLAWIIFLAVRNRKKITKDYLKELKKHKRFRMIAGIISVLLAIAIYFLPLNIYLKVVGIILIIFMYFTNYLFIYVRLVEKISMIKMVEPGKLTEGDWIVEEVEIDGKIIAGPKDLGIRKEQIEEILKLSALGKIRKIKVKYGIPFVPSFFLALVYTVIFNSVVLVSFIR